MLKNKFKMMKNNVKQRCISASILVVMTTLALPMNILADENGRYSQENSFLQESSYDIHEEIVFIEDLLAYEQFSNLMQDDLVDTFGYDFLRNQEIALDALHRIHSSFPQNRFGEIIHPTFYGGSYIDDAGNLVVLVVEDYADSTFARSLGNARLVNYSHN